MHGFDNFNIATWFDGVTFSPLSVRVEVQQVTRRTADALRHIVGVTSIAAGLALSGQAIAAQTDATSPSAFFVAGAGKPQAVDSSVIRREAPPSYVPALIRSMAGWKQLDEPAALELPNFF